MTSPWHTHPGEEIIYVLEGSLEYQLKGEPPVTLKAGDVLFIPAGAIHTAKARSSPRISSKKDCRSSHWPSERSAR